TRQGRVPQRPHAPGEAPDPVHLERNCDLAQGTGVEFVVTTMERGFGRRIVGSSARSRWSLAFALAAGLSLSLSMPAPAATDVVDQSQTNTSGFENTTQMAQTFTAGMTGRMDLVSLSSD